MPCANVASTAEDAEPFSLVVAAACAWLASSRSLIGAVEARMRRDCRDLCASDDDEEEADSAAAAEVAAATTACRDDRAGRALPPCRGETGVALADDGMVDEAAFEEAEAADVEAARAAAAAANAACAARSATA